MYQNLLLLLVSDLLRMKLFKKKKVRLILIYIIIAPNATVSGPSLETAVMLESCKVSSQMLNIRLKLEEKRRKIETEKRRMEVNLKRQRQKLNNAAFLQAVSKVKCF